MGQTDPLGLFRFSSTPLPQLLKALRSNFEGMGKEDSIEVQVSPNGREYMVLDKCFGFLYHAWVLVGEQEPEAIERHRDEEVRNQAAVDLARRFRLPLVATNGVCHATAAQREVLEVEISPLLLTQALKKANVTVTDQEIPARVAHR